ncbi:MAG: glycoside hydrolase family 3 N-terminal domain-containing protein [Bacteroidota bacterium]|nr:glycoside hydrolase family 3 N-terminal domain-containing protein [Bacteroidota bacterium]
MKKILITLFFLVFLKFIALSQITNPVAMHWVDSVFNSLNNDQRIAQLMVLRESSYNTDGPVYYDSAITDAIQKYNIGGIVLFQGNPVKQANFINYFQSIAKTPLMVCIDAEWGLGMRQDSVIPLNHQMMLGAVNDTSIVAAYGKVVAEQCKREGIHVNFAPVVDINNNPDNPVINDRSFGENKYKVARYGVIYMKAMQNEGVLACAKHFPGHGDVSVDSHLDLPVINKSMKQLDSLELYPFEQMFNAGVGSLMIAHLYIPAIDARANTATSLSKNNVTGLLRKKLNFNGLTFTDALGMKGVSKFFPGGQIAAQSLIAGNDMLCLPEDVAASIAKIREAIDNNKLNWNDVYSKCKKVLKYKYLYGIANVKPVDTTNLVHDLNTGVNDVRKLVADNAITLLKNNDKDLLPLSAFRAEKDIAYVGIGIDSANTFAQRMKNDYGADIFYFGYNEDSARVFSTAELIKKRYKSAVIGIHNYKRYPADNFGISIYALDLIHQIQQNNKTIIFDFGNPYALKNFCGSDNLVACYEDDSITQGSAADLLEGKIFAKGTLPVTVCEDFKYGMGIINGNLHLPFAEPEAVKLNAAKLAIIDSIANNGITDGAYPGCVVLVAKDGKVVFDKAFGKFNYDTPQPVTMNSIFDMASVTKVCATTLSVMKLYDEGKIKLNATLGTYLPWVRKSNKSKLIIRNILLHQAGLIAYIPFYKEVIDPLTGEPLPRIFSHYKNKKFSIRVAQNLYLRNDYRDSMYREILDSKLGRPNRYVYSDNDFILLGKIVETISGMTLDKYVNKYFYKPMGLSSTGFLPREKFDTNRIAPTEYEKQFRMQHLHADVHDPGSAMFGEVAGHAGLFSDANDLSAIMQMLLNGGTFNGKRYIRSSTIKLFSAYNSSVSRRGLGFDKPEKDNATRKDAYPAKSVSPLAIGHTGYTGTCVWADPKYNIVFIFLSNRVDPDGGENLKLLHMNVRGKIQEAIYNAMNK